MQIYIEEGCCSDAIWPLECAMTSSVSVCVIVRAYCLSVLCLFFCLNIVTAGILVEPPSSYLVKHRASFWFYNNRICKCMDQGRERERVFDQCEMGAVKLCLFKGTMISKQSSPIQENPLLKDISEEAQKMLLCTTKVQMPLESLQCVYYYVNIFYCFIILCKHILFQVLSL